MSRFQTIIALVTAAALRQQSSLFAGTAIPTLPTQPVTLENRAGQTLEITDGQRVFAGAVVNRGTLKVTDSTVTFAGTYTENGAYLSDPSTTNYTNLNVGSGGYLQGGLGDLFVVSGSFDNGSTQNTLWSTASSELDFGNGSAHLYQLAGVDSGTSMAGYTNNFAWGTVNLYSGQTLSLGTGAGAGFYTGALVLGSGTAQISSITGNGYNIYYDSLNPMNNYLGGQTYALSAGGSIKPVSSLPATMSGTSGQTINFTANVIGSVTFTYQWYKNSGTIGGATNPTYTISNATSGNSGTYTVVVSDTAGDTTTGTSVLNISAGVPILAPWGFVSMALLLVCVAGPFLRAKHLKS